MPTMTDKMTPEFEAAVRRLVEGFDNIPQDWAALVAQHKDGDEAVAMPMWGTLFRVSNMDRGNIEKLLRDPVPTDIHELIEFMDDHGIDADSLYVSNAMELIALAASDPDEIDDDDVSALRDAVIDEWRESMDEDAFLADSGWRDVGSTGIIAREFDGELLLGINGAGYSFYDSNWRRLYEELGYQWHR
jgi:hypothetical protein